MYPYYVAVCEDDETVREEIRDFCDRILDEEGIEHEIFVFRSPEGRSRAVSGQMPYIRLFASERTLCRNPRGRERIR